MDSEIVTRPLIEQLIKLTPGDTDSPAYEKITERHWRADNNLAKVQGILQVLAYVGAGVEKHHVQCAIWAADDLIKEAREIYGEV